MSDLSGQQLDNYRLIRLLGSGGFGDVYLAEHIHRKTQVAIKVLYTHLSQENLLEFLREVRTLLRLQHPNIVKIVDFSVDGPSPFIVMHYAPNGTLRQRHSQGARLSLPTIVSYVKQIAAALQHAHDEGLVHRDVKPANMLLGSKNEVLLSDFGITTISYTLDLARPQNIGGTWAYMAPEQINAKPMRESDQYALGAIVYEWLTGTPPFQGTIAELAIKHTSVPPPPLRTIIPNVPSDVEQVVLIALTKDPRRRFASVRAFATALEQAYQPQQFVGTTLLTYRGHSSGVVGVVWSPDGSRIASVSRGRVVHVWDAETGANVSTYTALSSFVYAVAWSPNGSHIASAGNDQTVQIWDPVSGGHKLTYYGHSSRLNAVAWSPNGSRIASAGNDQTVRVWDPATGDHKLIYDAHRDEVRSVAWSPNGSHIASAGNDQTVRVWDPATGRLRLDYTGHSSWVRAVAWSPNGNYIASASDDKTVQVWDASTGHTLHTYKGHQSSVYAVAWSPNGNYIASASDDKTVQVWNAVTRYLKLTYKGHQSSVYAVAWSPDGSRIASASNDNTVQVWGAP